MSLSSCNTKFFLFIGLLFLAMTSGVSAGTYYNGIVTQVLVGRLTNQVLFSVTGGSADTWPCSGTHSEGLNYAFRLDTPDGEAQLSAILTAYSSGTSISVIGTGACTILNNLEDVDYVWLGRP